LIVAHRAWELLTDSQKGAWNEWARPPATGRNTYIAQWLRFTTAAITPLSSPSAHIYTSPLTNLRISSWLPFFGIVFVEWDPDFSHDNPLLISVLETFSHRQTPTINQIPYHSRSHTDSGTQGLDITFLAPIVHIRIDQIDPENGDLLSRSLLRGILP